MKYIQILRVLAILLSGPDISLALASCRQGELQAVVECQRGQRWLALETCEDGKNLLSWGKSVTVIAESLPVRLTRQASGRETFESPLVLLLLEIPVGSDQGWADLRVSADRRRAPMQSSVVSWRRLSCWRHAAD